MPVSSPLRGLTASVMIALIAGLAGPVAAGEKEDTCTLQGEMMSALQKAKMDRVGKTKVVDKVIADNPQWPEKVHGTIPQLADFVYAQKRRDLKQVDLGAVSKQQCLDNWEEIKALQDS